MQSLRKCSNNPCSIVCVHKCFPERCTSAGAARHFSVRVLALTSTIDLSARCAAAEQPHMYRCFHTGQLTRGVALGSAPQRFRGCQQGLQSSSRSATVMAALPDSFAIRDKTIAVTGCSHGLGLEVCFRSRLADISAKLHTGCCSPRAHLCAACARIFCVPTRPCRRASCDSDMKGPGVHAVNNAYAYPLAILTLHGVTFDAASGSG
jgi:hypothetical protein